MHSTDEQLIAAYLEQGDQQAFRTLVERHKERIFSFLLRMVHDPETANDLFQETFLRAISAMQSRRGSYTPQQRWLSWVFRIARNVALDHLRSRRKWQDVSVRTEEECGSFWDRLPDDGPNVEEMFFRTEQEGWLAECVAQLPEEQREVLLLKHEGDLTFREIAEITGCSINTALGRMRYALHNLRRIMSASSRKEIVDP